MPLDPPLGLVNDISADVRAVVHDIDLHRDLAPHGAPVLEAYGGPSTLAGPPETVPVVSVSHDSFPFTFPDFGLVLVVVVDGR